MSAGRSARLKQASDAIYWLQHAADTAHNIHILSERAEFKRHGGFRIDLHIFEASIFLYFYLKIIESNTKNKLFEDIIRQQMEIVGFSYLLVQIQRKGRHVCDKRNHNFKHFKICV